MCEQKQEPDKCVLLSQLIEAISEKAGACSGELGHVVHLLTNIDGGKRAAANAVLQFRDHRDPQVRRTAVAAMNNFGAKPTEAREALLAYIDDDVSHVRLQAAIILARLREPLALPVLMEHLFDRDGRIQDFVAGLLSNYGEHAKSAVPSLIGGLQDADPYTRFSVATALWSMAADAKPAVPALQRAFQLESSVLPGGGSVRSRIGNALLRIDPIAAAQIGIEDRLEHFAGGAAKQSSGELPDV